MSHKLLQAVPVCLLLAAATASANERFLASDAIDVAQRREAVPTSPTDAFWQSVPAKSFALVPQRTVRLNDRVVNAALETAAPSQLQVRAASDGHDLAVWVEWPDATRDVAGTGETSVFGDAVAIELPVKFGGTERLPHVGMGDAKSHVLVYMQRAAQTGTQTSEYVAAGFGSLTRTNTAVAKMQLEYASGSKVWRAVFVRPLVANGHSLAQGLVPIAFAVWDGAGRQRGGNKSLTAWKFLHLSAYPVQPEYLAKMAWGYNPGDLGDAAKGKIMVESVCIACHRFGDKQIAPEGMAPDLSDVGAIASYGYLRDSLVNPSEVIVENLQLNRHYNKGAKQDAFNAYPNNDAFAWFTVDAQGNRTSKMPPFSYLSPQDLGNVVAYLKTFDGTRRSAP